MTTLGVDGGYTQADVTSFAKILTGWSIAGPRDSDFGAFKFRPAVHEPGEKVLLGARFEGEQLLVATGRTPNTGPLQVQQSGIALDQRGYGTSWGSLCRERSRNPSPTYPAR